MDHHHRRSKDANKKAAKHGHRHRRQTTREVPVVKDPWVVGPRLIYPHGYKPSGQRPSGERHPGQRPSGERPSLVNDPLTEVKRLIVSPPQHLPTGSMYSAGLPDQKVSDGISSQSLSQSLSHSTLPEWGVEFFDSRNMDQSNTSSVPRAWCTKHNVSVTQVLHSMSQELQDLHARGRLQPNWCRRPLCVQFVDPIFPFPDLGTGTRAGRGAGHAKETCSLFESEPWSTILKFHPEEMRRMPNMAKWAFGFPLLPHQSCRFMGIKLPPPLANPTQSNRTPPITQTHQKPIWSGIGDMSETKTSGAAAQIISPDIYPMVDILLLPNPLFWETLRTVERRSIVDKKDDDKTELEEREYRLGKGLRQSLDSFRQVAKKYIKCLFVPTALFDEGEPNGVTNGVTTSGGYGSLLVSSEWNRCVAHFPNHDPVGQGPTNQIGRELVVLTSNRDTSSVAFSSSLF